MKIPQGNEIYKHFKGNLYKVITIAIHSETMDKMVVYQALYGTFDVYVRPLTMFIEKVDREKYPEVQQEYRFQLVDELLNTTPIIDQVATSTSVLEQVKEPCKEQVVDETEEFHLDPLVEEFMDAYTYEERLNILVALHHRITDDMITIMAAVLDVEIEPGDIETRYEQLKTCVVTRERFECNRLR